MRALSLLLLIGCADGEPETDDSDSGSVDTDTGSAEFLLSCTEATSEGWTGTDDLGPTVPLTATVTEGFAGVEYQWTWSSHPTPYVPGLEGVVAGVWSDAAESGVNQALLAGTYSILVDATDGSEQASCTATATVVREGLTIELFSAAHSSDDFDLHFVRPAGTLDTADDCNHTNCQGSLEWGVLGTEDNPELWAARPVLGGTRWDFDIVRLLQPSLGSYSIYVRDNPVSAESGATTFTVRIWDGGTLLAELDRTVTGEGTDTLVANLEWPTGIVTEPN